MDTLKKLDILSFSNILNYLTHEEIYNLGQLNFFWREVCLKKVYYKELECDILDQMGYPKNPRSLEHDEKGNIFQKIKRINTECFNDSLLLVNKFPIFQDVRLKKLWENINNNHNVVVAGGYVTSMLHKKFFKSSDIDLYIRYEYKNIIKFICKEYEVEKITKLYKSVLNIKIKGINTIIQIIYCGFYDVIDLISQFNLLHLKCAIYMKKTYCTFDAMDCFVNKNIFYHSTTKKSTYNKIRRYGLEITNNLSNYTKDVEIITINAEEAKEIGFINKNDFNCKGLGLNISNNVNLIKLMMPLKFKDNLDFSKYFFVKYHLKIFQNQDLKSVWIEEFNDFLLKNEKIRYNINLNFDVEKEFNYFLQKIEIIRNDSNIFEKFNFAVEYNTNDIYELTRGFCNYNTSRKTRRILNYKLIELKNWDMFFRKNKFNFNSTGTNNSYCFCYERSQLKTLNFRKTIQKKCTCLQKENFIKNSKDVHLYNPHVIETTNNQRLKNEIFVKLKNYGEKLNLPMGICLSYTLKGVFIKDEISFHKFKFKCTQENKLKEVYDKILSLFPQDIKINTNIDLKKSMINNLYMEFMSEYLPCKVKLNEIFKVKFNIYYAKEFSEITDINEKIWNLYLDPKTQKLYNIKHHINHSIITPQYEKHYNFDEIHEDIIFLEK